MAVYIIGAGGHAKVVFDAARAAGITVDALAVSDVKEKGFSGLPVISENEITTEDRVIMGIGSNKLRIQLYKELKSINAEVLTIIHPTAWISPDAVIKEGSVVLARAVVNHSAMCGECSIINTSSVVEHDCMLSYGVHVSPGAVLCGNVKVGRESWIGANAVVKEGITINDCCVIGAGSAVVSDIASGTKGAGVPFKPL